MLSNAPPGTYTYNDEGPSGLLPLGIRTPDSIMSTGSSGLSGISSNHWRLPEKLQIVKPMEGSQTLHHWNRLATPTLSGLLDERPGVTIRGGRGLDELGLHLYSLSDVEEDADDYPNLGKQFQTYGSVYTYTNSTVMHPDDGMSITSSLPQSQMSSRLASVSSSRQPRYVVLRSVGHLFQQKFIVIFFVVVHRKHLVMVCREETLALHFQSI